MLYLFEWGKNQKLSEITFMFNKTLKVEYPNGRLNLILNVVFKSLMHFNYKEINALQI